MINAVVPGAAGRMGGRIIQMIQKSGEIRLLGAFEKPGHPAIGKDVGEVVGLGKIGIDLKGDISEVVKDADVGPAHGNRFDPKQGRIVVDPGVFDLLDDDLLQRFQDGSFHGRCLSGASGVF